MMEFRNPRYNQDGVTVDCEVNHPVYGWIPFTANPDDPEEHGRIIHAQTLAHGPAPFVAPNPRLGAYMARADLCKAMKDIGILSPEDAVLAMRGGWPDLFANATSSLSPSDRADMEIEWIEAQHIAYTSSLMFAVASRHAGDEVTSLLDQLFGITA